MRSWLTKTAVH
ncbi:hypothetical protein QZH41_000730 [Actinostola sp. cb2023]|nr:hypothetical protein QZH41_000730 [Actinostola sp. cb2023]